MAKKKKPGRNDRKKTKRKLMKGLTKTAWGGRK